MGVDVSWHIKQMLLFFFYMHQLFWDLLLFPPELISVSRLSCPTSVLVTHPVTLPMVATRITQDNWITVASFLVLVIKFLAHQPLCTVSCAFCAPSCALSSAVAYSLSNSVCACFSPHTVVPILARKSLHGHLPVAVLCSAPRHMTDVHSS
jgi:hypothetical protein